MTKEELYEKALRKWGAEDQVWMVIEECSELLNALSKFRRSRATADDIITEVADVTIMCGQLGVLFGQDKIDAEIERKLTRLEERLSK